MAFSSAEKQKIPIVVGDEAIAFCPSCKAIQTIWLTNGVINQTRKFTQRGEQVYHDCGSTTPCRLYPSI